jgi:hypothetical protein
MNSANVIRPWRTTSATIGFIVDQPSTAEGAPLVVRFRDPVGASLTALPCRCSRPAVATTGKALAASVVQTS